jgi:endonuclease G, mitochondrial
MIPLRERSNGAARAATAMDFEEIIRSLSGERRRASPRQIEQRRNVLMEQYEDATFARVRLERILKGNDLSDITYLARGLIRARAVCRVVVREGGRVAGYGSGFLVGPGALLTNHHVLENADQVRGSFAQFRYELDLDGSELSPVEFAFRTNPSPIIFRDLDMALVAVEPRSIDGQMLDQFGWIRLNPDPRKAFIGEYLTIIQHPNGERKQVCVRENKLLKYDDNGPYVWYETDTVGGSSGSPVFNDSWDVVALHHSGVPRKKKIGNKIVWLAKNGKPWTEDMGDDQVDWIANEGVRISTIMDYLQQQHGAHPLARAVLDASSAPPVEKMLQDTGLTDSGGILTRTTADGMTRIFIPVDIRVGGVGAPGGAIAVGGPSAAGVPSTGVSFISGAVEKIEIDQTNYAERKGYDPKFLGNDITVPLPKVKASQSKHVFKIGTKSELKYWTYSVVMNKTRRLAFFSAANVDPSRWRGNRDADGDKWFRDSRVEAIDPKLQVGEEFYKKQKTFEVDRSKTPFDQGHLSSRNDVQWGDTDDLAKRNGDDSYHYTNCAPQHFAFNENRTISGLWNRLEVHVATKLTNGGRLCIINGPIFGAPVCTTGPDGRLHLNVNGTRVPDKTFGSVKIPKQFFKVAAYRDGNALKAAAFIVTQEDLLATTTRLHDDELSVLSDAEVRLYHVKVSSLAKLTGLNFGPLAGAADTHEIAVSADESGPIESEDDLGF